MLNNKEKIKMLIELADTIQEADEVIEEYTDYKSNETKLAFINGLFDFQIVSRKNECIKDDYLSALSVIINKKWRI